MKTDGTIMATETDLIFNSSRRGRVRPEASRIKVRNNKEVHICQRTGLAAERKK